MTRLCIEMLPAAQGDAIWIEWSDQTEHHRILIDGGPGKSYPALRDRIGRLPAGERRLDLITITHIDTDHIDGVVTLLLDDLGVEFDDIWFNGRNHIYRPLSPVAGNHYLGGVEGEVLSAILGLPRFRWNEAFHGKAIVVHPGVRSFPSMSLGGLTLTILSPGVNQLEKLAKTWNVDVTKALQSLELVPGGATEDEVAKAIHSGGLDVARRLLDSRYRKRLAPPAEWEQPSEEDVFLGDSSKANGSSIALLVEDKDRKTAALFTGDAHASVLLDSITRLLVYRGEHRLQLDALKLPHHGSKHNLSANLLNKLDCDTFLFSTDGSHGFGHPDDETIDLILDYARHRSRRPSLFFNYLSDRTEPWMSRSKGNGLLYEAHCPSKGRGEHGLLIEVGPES